MNKFTDTLRDNFKKSKCVHCQFQVHSMDEAIPHLRQQHGIYAPDEHPLSLLFAFPLLLMILLFVILDNIKKGQFYNIADPLSWQKSLSQNLDDLEERQFHILAHR